MEKQMELCPSCQQEVWVEPAVRRLYKCRSCGQTFTFSPDAAPAAGQPTAEPLARAGTPGVGGAHSSEVGTSSPPDLVETPFIRDLLGRAQAYLREGLPAHLCGPAGVGKTTIALHLAHQLGRPVVLIHGDDQMGTSDLVGKDNGYQRAYVRDNYIHTVLKINEEVKPVWVDKALAEACREGYTVVYDEFTRSRPEANNVLLSVLEERVLPLRGALITVHPDFKVIFTSNPADYAGVHGAQDALLDRIVTIYLNGFDRDTEVAIVRSRSKLPLAGVERIVDLVRAFRELTLKTITSSVRPCLMIAWILQARGGHAYASDPIFIQTCRDVLLSAASRTSPDLLNDGQIEETLLRLVQEVCSAPLHPEHSTVEVLTYAPLPDNPMTELFQDKEVEELLLRKIREKGLAGKLLSDALRAAETVSVAEKERPSTQEAALATPAMP